MAEIKNQEELEREYEKFYEEADNEWDKASHNLIDLIFSHFDYYLYKNDCELKRDEKTAEEWLAYKKAILDSKEIIEFTIKREQYFWRCNIDCIRTHF